MIRFLFILFTVLAPMGTEAGSQQKDNLGLNDDYLLSTRRSLLYNRVIAGVRGENYFTGFLVGVKKDTLMLLVEGKAKKILLQDLLTIKMELEDDSYGKKVVAGMLLGAYAGNLLANQSRNQPTAFNSGESGFYLFFINFLSAGIGGGMVFLANSNSKMEETFIFKGTFEEKQLQIEKFRGIIQGDYSKSFSQNHFHLSTHMGWVNTQGANSLKNAGYSVNDYYYDDGEGVSKLNMLRRIQLTYSYSQLVDLGAAVMWLGEPSVFGENVQDYSFIHHNLDGKGYYFVVLYSLFKEKMPDKITWKIGAGVGMAEINYNIKDSYYYNNDSVENQKTYKSGIVFSELNYMLFENLSFGISADYVIMEDESIDIQINDNKIINYKVVLGNSSFGLNFGFHF